MVLNTSYKICLQSVETGYLEILHNIEAYSLYHKYKGKDKRAVND